MLLNLDSVNLSLFHKNYSNLKSVASNTDDKLVISALAVRWVAEKIGTLVIGSESEKQRKFAMDNFLELSVLWAHILAAKSNIGWLSCFVWDGKQFFTLAAFSENAVIKCSAPDAKVIIPYEQRFVEKKKQQQTPL